MSSIKDLLGSDMNSTYRKQLNEGKKLVNKWKKTGLLDEMENEYDQHQIAILLENQARQLIDEISRTGTSANSEEWSGVALPLVRRIFSEIAAKDFVSVQAMSLPSGLVFYLDYKYGTAQPGFTTTDGSGTTIQQNTLHGVTNQPGAPTEGLYGAGRFGYSLNDKQSSGTALVYTSGSVSYGDVNYNPDLSASLSQLRKVTVTFTTESYDANGVRAFKISGANVVTYFPAYTAAVDALGAASTTKVTFIVSASDAVGQPTVAWHTAPTAATTRGDFEDTAGNATTETIQIPEINVSLRSEAIVAKTRKLKAVWTPEFAQDLNAYHSIDAEAELTSILSEYISMEIDLEILDMLIENAITTEYWSAKVGASKTGTAGTEADFTSQAINIDGIALQYSQNTWFQTLGTKIQKVSNTIHAKTMRGGANFIVTSPNVATILESIPGYAADTDGNKMQFAMGVQKAGMLNSRFTVYKNPYMKEDLLLLGFRGTQFLETGAVYAPYVPLIMTPLIYDPTNLTPRKGVMTRYAKKMVRPEFFGKINVSHINLV